MAERQASGPITTAALRDLADEAKLHAKRGHLGEMIFVLGRVSQWAENAARIAEETAEEAPG